MMGRKESLKIKRNMKTEQIITYGQYSYFDSSTVYNNFWISKIGSLTRLMMTLRISYGFSVAMMRILCLYFETNGFSGLFCLLLGSFSSYWISSSSLAMRMCAWSYCIFYATFGWYHWDVCSFFSKNKQRCSSYHTWPHSPCAKDGHFSFWNQKSKLTLHSIFYIFALEIQA